MKGVNSISVVFLLVWLGTLLAFMSIMDDGRAEVHRIEGPWIIQDDTCLKDGTWIVENGTMEVDARVELDNVSLILNGHSLDVNSSGRFIVRNSTITDSLHRLHISNVGVCKFYDSTFTQFAASGIGIYQPGGLLEMVGCKVENGTYLMRLAGSLTMKDCVVRNFTRDGARIWTYDMSWQPSTITIEDCTFNMSGRSISSVWVIGSEDSAYDCRITIKDCYLEGSYSSIRLSDIWGAGSVEVTGNIGEGSAISLSNCGRFVTTHHNRWQNAGIWININDHGTPDVHNETVIGGDTGVHIYSNDPIELWDITILGTEGGIICTGGNVDIYRSHIKTSRYDFVIPWAGGPTTAHIRIHDCTHNRTGYISKYIVDGTIEETVTTKFIPIVWQNSIPIEEGTITFLNESGSPIGTIHLPGDQVARLTRWMVSLDGNISCDMATAEYMLGGVRFHSAPFGLGLMETMSLLIVDDFLPELAIETPENMSDVSGWQLDFSGTVHEVGSGLATISVRVDDEEWMSVDPLRTGRWSRMLEFVSDGVHTFSVRATDRTGNTNMTSISNVSIDSILPPIDLVEPGLNVNTAKVLMVIWTEMGATAFINDQPVLVDRFGRIRKEVTLEGTSNTFVVRVRDPVGNENVTMFTIVFDILPPLLMVEDPLDGSYTNLHGITVMGITEVDATIKVNDLNTSRNGERFSIQMGLDEGRNTFYVVATDLAGNVNRVTITIHVDWEGPIIEISRPAPSLRNVTGSEITVSGTVVDLYDVEITVWGVEAYVVGMEWFAHIQLEEGMNDIWINAIDRAGNRATTSIQVRLDTKPLEYSVVLVVGDRTFHPWDADIVVGDISGMLRIDLNEPAIVKVLGQSEVQVNAGIHSIRVDLDHGHESLVIDVEDLLGNVAPQVTFRLYVDTEEPVARAGRDVVTDTHEVVLFDGTASTDEHGIIDYIWTYRKDGRTVQFEGSRMTHSFSEPGTYSVLLTVTDGAGHSATDVILVKVEDSSAPSSLNLPLIMGASVLVVVLLYIITYLLPKRGS